MEYFFKFISENYYRSFNYHFYTTKDRTYLIVGFEDGYNPVVDDWLKYVNIHLIDFDSKQVWLYEK